MFPITAAVAGAAWAIAGSLHYSLIATARLRHRDPAAYLREALHAALRQASAVTLPL